MREIVVLSGKGGTGKTSITAAFATLAENAVIADCDVDAADLHLVLKPEIRRSCSFIGAKKAVILSDKCEQCGLCESLCRFGAVSSPPDGEPRIDELQCEGCGVCANLCPLGAIIMRDTVGGYWFVSETRAGPMVHARLNPGGENSGKLVALVRKEARSLAEQRGAEVILTDGPPGIGCPVIACLAETDLVVIVTEPSVSGLHDLKRVAELASHFETPASVIINKADINPDHCEQIRRFASQAGMDILGELPHDPIVTESQLAERSVVEYSDGPVSHALRHMWREIAPRRQ